MKLRYLSILGISILARGAFAQDLSAPKCPGGTPLSTAQIAQDACQQAYDVYQLLAPQLGLALAGGNATAGQGGVLGGIGHLSVGIRMNGFRGVLPDINSPAFAQSTTGAQRRTLPTTNTWVGLPTADAAIGIFKGFPLSLTNILGLDALVSASYVPTISQTDFSVTPSSNFQFGYGARLGLLSESIISPGVSVTWIERDLPTSELSAKLNGASLSVTETKVKTQSWRVVASKNLIRFSVAGGVGQDKYDESAVVRGSISASGISASSQAPGTEQTLTRTNMFADVAANLTMLKIIGEVGYATGGTVQTYNSFAGGRADRGYTYGSLGLRLSW